MTPMTGTQPHSSMDVGKRQSQELKPTHWPSLFSEEFQKKKTQQQQQYQQQQKQHNDKRNARDYWSRLQLETPAMTLRKVGHGS